jgi:hypothetical protein
VHQGVLKYPYHEYEEVEIGRAAALTQCRGLTSECDEMWSYIGEKAAVWWSWYATDHHSGTVLAYVFG